MTGSTPAQTVSRSTPVRVIVLAACALVVSLPITLPPAGAQQASALVAVAPFADEVNLRDDLARWTSARLVALLSRKGVEVIPISRMESAMRQVGLRPIDLVSLAANETLARELGADAVITGRIIRADLEHEGTLIPVEPPAGPTEALVTLRLRLMVVATRRLSYADVTGHAVGGFRGLARAADQALQQYVDRWPVTLP